jgi:hypothetical protein
LKDAVLVGGMKLWDVVVTQEEIEGTFKQLKLPYKFGFQTNFPSFNARILWEFELSPDSRIVNVVDYANFDFLSGG